MITVFNDHNIGHHTMSRSLSLSLTAFSFGTSENAILEIGKPDIKGSRFCHLHVVSQSLVDIALPHCPTNPHLWEELPRHLGLHQLCV
jgi:hypothetical protein